jgi:hypothetical protein
MMMGNLKRISLLICFLLLLPVYEAQSQVQRICIPSSPTANDCIVVTKTTPMPTDPGAAPSGSATATNQTSQITQETAINAVLGLQVDAACSTDNGTCTVAALFKRNNQRLTSILTAIGSPLQAGGSVGISGTLPAFANTPTFNLGTIGTAATAANQTTANASLASIDTKTPTLGQQAGAGSSPVVLSSDPDLRPSTGAITVQDTGSTTASGQNSVTVVTGTPTAGSTQSQAINGISTTRIQASGTFTGTGTIEGSIDGGTTWYALPARVVGTVFTGSTFTAIGLFDTDSSGLTNIRVRATAAMTGSLVIRFVSSATSGPVQVLNPMRLVDNGSGVTAVVKTASTPPVSTDPAVVVTPMAIGLTPTDRTITSATGASQTVANANTSRRELTIVNTGNANCGINPTGGTAAIGGAGTLTLYPGGSYTPRIPTLAAVTAICAAGQSLYVDEG